MSLESHDIHHLRAAHGYVELGMYLDATAELAAINEEYSDMSELVAVRVAIHGGLKEWKAMLAEAKKLFERDPCNPQWPISLAYATRRARNIEEARTILLEALYRFPEEAMIRYNLACYECQVGNLDTAKDYLDQAIALAPNCRGLALEDSDLKPLRGRIE